MRTDEYGQSCPATLGEYRDICSTLGGNECDAVKYLDNKIAESPHGRDELVLADDSQMRMLLFPMITRRSNYGRHETP